MVAPTYDEIVRAPKALLHDHLDGGLRPATVLELAEPVGHRLPADDPVALQLWFESAADSGSLERYLETFTHTVAVMQTTEALHRVAYECALDLAADGVVYAEVRFAPEQHLSRGLCGTSGSRWSCARRPTCRPGPRPRSRNTPSGSFVTCGSGSPSTPTTG